MTPAQPPLSPSRSPLVVVGVDQEWSARSLESVLGPHGFALVRARSGQQILALAATVQADVVLVDSRLPDLDGLDVCRRLRDERLVSAHVPIILMTSAAAPREFVREAYEAGVWSVWEQPLDGELLLLRLNTWVRSKRAVDAAESTRHVDEVAGVYTANGLRYRVREVLAEALRRQTPVSCIAIGAVTASAVNGAEAVPRGMLSGEITRAIASVARGSDVVGQTGDGEYAILAPVTTRDGAQALVERLRERVAAMPAHIEQGEVTRIIVRAGIATEDRPEPWQVDGADLLRRASTALRYARSSRSVTVPSFSDVPASFV